MQLSDLWVFTEPQEGATYDDLFAVARPDRRPDHIPGLWNTPDGERFSYPGPRWQLRDSPALPKPVQPGGPPIIIGGGGPTRTPRLAARHAAELNVPFSSLEAFAERQDRVGAACEAIGRDPSSMIYSAALVVCCGVDESGVGRRAAAIGREVAELRRTGRRAPRTRWQPRCEAGETPARSGPTCRYSTSPISTTWT